MSASLNRVRARLADRSGFTLIEVLVAFTVMTLLLSVLFRGVVGLRAGSAAFDDRTKRELVAAAVLEAALVDRDLSAGTRSGFRNGLRWKVITKPVDLSAQMPPPPRKQTQPQPPTGAQPEPRKEPKTDWQPQRLIVQIEGRGKPLEIETIRLVKPGSGS